MMHRMLLACLLLLPIRHAAAQQAGGLAEMTCGQAAAVRGLDTRHLAAALLGARAARSGRARFSAQGVDAAVAAITAGCAMDGAGSRRVAAIVAALPAAPEAAGDLDLATLTCLGLAPHWRGAARSLVPFMVGWRDAAADAPLTRAVLDLVGEGLPRICREEANRERPIAEVIGALR